MTSISDFAPELLHRVFRLCSQSDLVSLSRVNYTFGEAADYLLHRDIRISCNFLQRFGPQLRAKTSLFRTLTSNPQKAAFLRYLHVGLMSGNTKDQESCNYHVLTQIADALRNTHGLEDLRIIVRRPESLSYSDASKGKLSEVIKGGYFQLHTLYCDSYQDLEEIIVSQKHLRLLGIYTDDYRSGYRNVSKLFNNSRIDGNSNFPGIFMATYYELSYNIDQWILFPELCLPGQTFTLCRDIMTFVGQDRGKYDLMPVYLHRMLTLHVFDFSSAKTAIICEVVEAMAQYFVNCEILTMRVQTSVGDKTVSKPWRIPGLSTSINQFKQLLGLSFYVWASDNSTLTLREAEDDLRSVLFEEFVHVVGLRQVQACLKACYIFAQRAADILDWEVESHNIDGDVYW
ncbi:hypothetical protein JOM56_012448 [Amanita muscaria]